MDCHMDTLHWMVEQCKSLSMSFNLMPSPLRVRTSFNSLWVTSAAVAGVVCVKLMVAGVAMPPNI